MNNEEVAKEIEEELDEDEIHLERTRQGDRRFVREALERGEVINTLGQDSRGYKFNVLYSAPLSFFIDPKDIVLDD